MSAAKERLPTALRAVCQPLPESYLSIFEDARSCLVLRITTAYEQGYGHASRLELTNPYAPGTLESHAWEQGREVGRQRQPTPPGDDTLRSMNGDLCGFALRWKVDGDYLRCAKCNRPHIASRADMAFKHMAGCAKDSSKPTYPWRELIEILRPLIDTPAP